MPLQEPVTRNLILNETPRRATWIGPMVGFIVGLVVGGLAVWSIGSRNVADTQTSTDAVGSRASMEIEAATAQPAATPLDLAGATPDEPGPSAQTPAEQARVELEELISTINETPESDRQQAVNDMIYRLRSLGPEGLQAVRDFLKSGQDVKLRNGVRFGAGRLTEAPSLRLAMIETLDTWRDPAAIAASLEVLQETPSLFEAIVAIRNLESLSPGTYRAEALKTVNEMIATPDAGNNGMAGRDSVLALEAFRYFKAPELIPAFESLLRKEPDMTGDYIIALTAFPETERRAALQRILLDPTLVASLSEDPSNLKRLDLTDPVIRTTVANAFNSRMTQKQRDEYLTDFGEDVRYGGVSPLLLPNAAPLGSPQPAVRRSELEAKFQLLDEIEPYATSPVLRQRVQEAREGLAKLLQQR